MNNLTQATESLAKSTPQRPRILVRYLGGYAIKRLVVTPESRFATCDQINESAGRALIKRGITLHEESAWVW